MLFQPVWGDDSHALAVTVKSYRGDRLSHFMLNAYWEPLEFELPIPAVGTGWRRLIDTALKPPLDIAEAATPSLVEWSNYRVEAHSLVVLTSKILPQAALGSWRKL